jgi:Calcineurin-like phosphoesterase
MKENGNQYDIIGDIHGHADTLRALLAKLGYAERAGLHFHPERRAIFVGDFVDRGPKIRETLQIVRAMVEGGEALAVIGNHEYNAIRYHTKGLDGKPLRPHNEIDEGHKHYKNFKQHRATLEQLARPFPEEWAGWLAWFKTLPLSLDLGALRVVHASWRQESVDAVGDRRFSDEAFLRAASKPHDADHDAVSALLNGPGLPLPEGYLACDKEGVPPREDSRAMGGKAAEWQRADLPGLRVSAG